MAFLGKRKGVSGIISGVFLVAVAVMIFNVLAWQFFQYDVYRQIAVERDQREWERFNERVIISDYLNMGNASYLRLKIRNIGSVPAHIVTVYLNDTTANIPRALVLANYITSNCSAWVTPGTEKWINTTISLTSGNLYDLKIATERGNIGIYLKLLGGERGQTPQGTQPAPFVFAFIAEDFQYIYGTETWSTQRGAWWITQGGGYLVVFRMKLKNTYESTVRIKAASALNWMWFNPNSTVNPGNPSSLAIAYRCFIVAPWSTPTNTQNFVSQSLGAAQSDYLYFASMYEGKGSNEGSELNKLDDRVNGDHHIFAVVIYTVDGDQTGTIYGATVAIIGARQKVVGH